MAPAEATPGARLLSFLRRGPADVVSAGVDGKVLLDGGDRGSIAASVAELHRLCSDGLVRREAGRIALAASSAPGASAKAGPGRVIAAAAIPVGGEAAPAIVNVAESPLGLLARRTGRDGKLFIDGKEFEAGERLRRDYTRGRIMPRLGANWVASVAGGRRGGTRGGMAELTDSALAARQRVEQALAAVGPELSGVLIDVCCFLKGLETVEAERRWPARSAKVVLRAGLSALARHYDPPPARGSRPPLMLHWGAEDFRPTLR